MLEELLADMTDLNLITEGDIKYNMMRLGRAKPESVRPLKVTFRNSIIKDRVLDCCPNLKGKEKWAGISIVPDLTKTQRKLAKQEREKLKAKVIKNNEERSETERTF